MIARLLWDVASPEPRVGAVPWLGYAAVTSFWCVWIGYALFGVDALKNTHYDMNLTLHFFWDGPEKRRWQYQVTKVQGILGETFPDGSTGTALPFDKLWEFADKLRPAAEDGGEDENLADQIASTIMQGAIEKTQANLIKYSTEKGFTALWIMSRTGKIQVHNIPINRPDHVWMVRVFNFPLDGLEEPEYVDHDISEDSLDY